MSGLQSRVRMSNTIIDQRLQLTFAALTEAQMLSIHSHYIDRQGRFLSFAIPNSLLSGMLAPASFTLINGSWLYASPPQVEDVPGLNRYTVSVDLVNAPPENATASGCRLNVPVTLEAGQATPAETGTTTIEFDPPLEVDGTSGIVELPVVGVDGLVTKVVITVSFVKFAVPDDPSPFTYNNEVAFFLAGPDDEFGYIGLTYGFPIGQAGTSASATITFDDDFAQFDYPPTATDLVSGSYGPDDPLSYFVGGTANGTWYFEYGDLYEDEAPLRIYSVSITVT